MPCVISFRIPYIRSESVVNGSDSYSHLLVPFGVGFLIRVDPPFASEKKCMRWMRWRKTRNPGSELKVTLVITGEGGESDEGYYLRAAPHSAPSELPLAISLKFFASPASLFFVALGRPSYFLHDSYLGFCAFEMH